MMAMAAAGAAHAAPGISFSSTRLDYGNQGLGIRSAAQTLTITNSGASPLLIYSLSFSGANPDDFVIGSDSRQGMLVPGAFRTVGIQFRPLAAGARSAVLAVSDNAAGSPQLVSLSGAGVTTYLDRSPRNVNFGSTPVGVAIEQAVTIRNDGNTTLTIGSLWIGYGNQVPSGGFYWKPGAGYTPTLAPGASTSIVVGSNPVQTGAWNATLFIFDDAPFSPHLVSLAVTATPALVPDVNFNANPLDFLKRAYGGPPTILGVALTNNGGAPLAIQSIRIAGLNVGDFSIVTDSGEATLAPGAWRGLTIQFKPGAVGDRQAYLTVTDDAAGSPQQLLLKGEGVSTYVARFPRSVDFGTRAVGTTREQVVTIRNDNGGSTLHIDSTRTAIVGTNAGDFYWRPAAGFRSELPYSYSTDIIVGFRPRTTGSKSAVLAIVDDAPYSPHNVSLTGIGN